MSIGTLYTSKYKIASHKRFAYTNLHEICTIVLTSITHTLYIFSLYCTTNKPLVQKF